MARATSFLLLGTACLGASAGLIYNSLSLSLSPADDNGLAVTNPLHDFGDVRQEEKLTTSFVVRNKSARQVTLLDPVSDCGCTVPELVEKRLPPSASTRMHVELDTGIARGEIERAIRIHYTIDGETNLRTLAVRVRANVKPDFAVEPSRLEFEAGKSSEALVQFFPSADGRLELMDVRSNHRAFRGHILPPAHQNDSWRVRVDFDRAKWDSFNAMASLEVMTNSTRQPVYPIRINVIP